MLLAREHLKNVSRITDQPTEITWPKARGRDKGGERIAALAFHCRVETRIGVLSVFPYHMPDSTPGFGLFHP